MPVSAVQDFAIYLKLIHKLSTDQTSNTNKRVLKLLQLAWMQMRTKLE